MANEIKGPSGGIPYPLQQRRGVTRDTVQFIPAHDGVTRNRDYQPEQGYPQGPSPIAVPGKAIIPNVINNPYTAGNVTNINQAPQQASYEPTIDNNPTQSPQSKIQVTPTANFLPYGDFTPVNFLIGTQGVNVLQRSDSQRIYLFLLNTDLNATGNTIFVGFGALSNPANLGAPLVPGGSFLFDAAVPQNDIYAIASGAGTTLYCLYCVKVI